MMKSNRMGMILTLVLAWLVGMVFIYAAVLKIIEPEKFAQAIKNYKMVPLVFINLMAVILPWWEVTAGIAMFIPSWRRAASILIFGLACVFTLAVSTAMIRGLDIQCGCFGQHSARAGLQTLIVDLAILLATGLIVWVRYRKPANPKRLKSQSDLKLIFQILKI